MISLALPIIVSSACDSVMMFTDRLFLSRLGPEEMSASMGGGMSAFMLMSFFVGLMGYSTAVTAQYFGAGKKSTCPRVTVQAMTIAVLAVPFLLLMTPLVSKFFMNSGLSAGQVEHQVPYFEILMYGSLAGLSRFVFSSFFSGIGRTRIVMAAAVTALVCNMIFSYILIFGKLGLPAMGIRGAAYGTIAGSVVSVTMLGYAYLRYLRMEGLSFSEVFRFDRVILVKILRYGFPAGLELFLNMTAFTILIILYQSVSLASATAVTIMFNWDHVAFIPLIGLEIGVTSLFGRYLGAKRLDIAHKSLMSGLKAGTVYSVILAVLFLFMPEMLTNIFAPDGYDPVFEEVRAQAVFMLRCATVYVAVNAVIIVYAGALRGAGDTYAAMLITVGVMWVMTGISYVTLYIFNMSAENSWLTLVILFMIMPWLLYARYKNGKWKTLNAAA